MSAYRIQILIKLTPLFLLYIAKMRPNYHPQAYPARQQYSDASYQPQPYHRSPPAKSNNYPAEQHQSYAHSHVFYTPTAETSKKMFTSIKMQEDKIEAIDAVMRKKTSKMEKVYTKTEQEAFLQELEAYIYF